MYSPWSVDLSGNWKEWPWPALLAAEVKAACLQLRDVIVYADPKWGIVLPEGDFRWKHNTVAAELLDAPLEKHGGRVLRVVSGRIRRSCVRLDHAPCALLRQPTRSTEGLDGVL